MLYVARQVAESKLAWASFASTDSTRTSCQSGVWKGPKITLTKTSMTASSSGTNNVVAAHAYCALSYTYYLDKLNQFCSLSESPAGIWKLSADDATCIASCFDF